MVVSSASEDATRLLFATASKSVRNLTVLARCTGASADKGFSLGLISLHSLLFFACLTLEPVCFTSVGSSTAYVS